MNIKLLVIRTSDPQKLSAFYSLLGFTFDYHKHGKSPYHYSATIDKLVLEIYPLAETQTEPDRHLRLGFEVNDFDETIKALQDNNVEFTKPTTTDFGLITIVSDPDGRKIELYKS